MTGARAYLLKMILHDWPDKEALQILKNIVPAMNRDHSRILIAEQILPTGKEVPMLVAGLDTIVMLAYAAVERTENQWSRLLAEAGLKISRFWALKTGDGIIEAMLA